MKLTEKKKVNSAIMLFMTAYMVSYLTRINFGAVLTEIIADTGLSKTALSAAVTGSFITYGAGQVISGFFGDRFQPKKLVLCGLLLSCCMNLLIPLCSSPLLMAAVWCVNGFAQAFMWPPIVRLMVYLFTDEDYKRASYMVSWGAAFGTIIIYLMAPVLIIISGWRSVFLFSALCGIIMCIIWQKKCYTLDENEASHKTGHRNAPSIKHTGRKIANAAISDYNEAANGTFEKKKTVVLLFSVIMLIIILQGSLRDGVTTWMPSYISETYALGSAVSILTGVVLPIFHIICNRFALAVYKKAPSSPLLCAGIFFGTGAIATIALIFLTGNNAFGSVLSTALLTGCMHGVNLMMTCMVPPYFKEGGNVSLVSGVLNAGTYIGSAISTYGIALISQHAGWSVTIIVWFFIALFGSILCFLGLPVWKKRFH
ncbi:MAG: MFS transporter [Roseburia sp.]|nr:MFS transporter [Roseburia sp.]